MYGAETSKRLDEAGIAPGDRIKVAKKGKVYEGVLMPRPEIGNGNILIIKQDDGYNIGINADGAGIEKLRGKTEGMVFPKAQMRQGSSLPKVRLVYTGGTIGAKIDYKTGGVYMLTKPEELLYEVPELSDIAEISVSQTSSIASEDMSSDEWAAIANEVSRSINNGARGVIVTLGTDSMHYASAALSFMLRDLNAPVVLTGAQRSPDRGSSDAFQNLICSAHLAAKSDMAEVGICMHDSSSDGRCAFLRGTKARKMHTSRRDAFRPINAKPIAFVDADGTMAYVSSYKKADWKGKVTPLTGFERKVAFVKAFPNSDPDIIDYYAGRGYRGIVIEGMGLGHTPASTVKKELSWIPHVRSATDSGIVIGITSQCIYGRVNPNVYRNLRLLHNAGAIHCEDMLPETAYVKLGWLLGNYKPEEARAMLSRNLAGEISRRTTYNEFLI